MSAVSLQGISLTEEQAARALDLANQAPEEALAAIKVSPAAAEAILARRPFASLEQLAALEGVGAETVGVLKAQLERLDAGEREESQVVEGTSLWKDAWGRLLKNKMAVVCGVVFVVIVLFCVVGAFFGQDPSAQDIDYGAQGPSWAHWFGTDEFGRDLMARVQEGGRISLAVGLISTVVSLIIGVTYGAISGYFGGVVDNFMMRVVDVLFALPYMFIVILVMTIIPPELRKGDASVYLLFLILGAVQWLVMARIVRGQVLTLKRREYVEAARSIGVKTGKIIFRHLIPNALGPIIIYSTLTVPAVILEESFLSFIGLGVQAPKASWGTLLSEGSIAMVIYPWLLIFPAALMSLTLFSLNFLGDGLRDALDPQLRKD